MPYIPKGNRENTMGKVHIKPEPVPADPHFTTRAKVSAKLRPMTIDDAPFILDSWCGSFSKSPVTGPIDPQLFKIEQRNRINNLIPKCRVVVACDPDRPNNILGYAVLETPREPGGLWILHYCLVKYEVQGRGIATALLAPFLTVSPGGMMFYTHWTFAMKFFGKDYLIYNHYLLDHASPEAKQPVPTSGRMYYGDPNS